MARKLLIGVDVGGTNTDSVLLDPSSVQLNGQGVLAWHKSPTTPDVSVGIVDAIKKLFDGSKEVGPKDIASVTIGTTHFINAVIERDRSRLAPVAVLRLSGPYGDLTHPFCDFPPSLTAILKGHTAQLDGGFKVDGALVKPVNEAQVRAECKLIRQKGINSIVIIGNFSPMDNSQEIQVEKIVKEEIPGSFIVKSYEVANIGFLERENAAILNAAILPFARKIISSFEQAVTSLGISAPLLLTQNDGTVLPAHQAVKIPIRSFSSGATNSMRGASFLCSHDPELKGKPVIVMDIGGTTTDVGMLLANGFPRQSASYSTVGGVRMNFPMPFVESVGFGGGSIVRATSEELTIGPDSVGSEIQTRALLFGGNTITATDSKLAASLFAGDKTLLATIPVTDSSVLSSLDKPFCAKFEEKSKLILESALDRIKTSPDPIPVLLVGGGSILAPTQLEGASKVIRPNYFGIANAIGAAISKVSALVDTIVETSDKVDIETLKDQVCEKAIRAAVANNAVEESVYIAELECIPLPYVMNKIRLIVKAVGDMDNNKTVHKVADSESEYDIGGEIFKDAAVEGDDTSKIEDGTSILGSIDIEHYKPLINDQREWVISEVDLEFIALGAYILGAGGGGNPYSVFLRIRQQLRQGASIRVVDIKELLQRNKENGISGKIITCGCAGSPTVGVEQIQGSEQEHAYDTFRKYVCPEEAPQAVISIEIGGGNGLESMRLGAGRDLLCVDADLMGRAFPTLWQTTPTIFSPDRVVLAPSAFSDGNGNDGFFASAESPLVLENMIRATLSQLGCRVGTVNGLESVSNMAEWAVTNTTSQAWRIGRSVFLARQKNQIDEVAKHIIDANGGPKSGREIFRGKIIGVDRRLEGGYSFGEVIIQSSDLFAKSGKPMKLIIPFKNENISAELEDPDTGKRSVIAIVPDLICVIDIQNGSNIGNPEFRYGLTVCVLVLACSTKWTSSAAALEIGGPKGFGLEDPYVPCGVYIEPRSVIEEFHVRK